MEEPIFKIKFNIHLPESPGIPLLGIYLPKRNENIFPHKDVYTDVHNNFIQNWKWPKCPSTNVTYLTIEYYL